MNKKENHLEWFKKANEDEKAADVLFADSGVFSVVCFLSQQASEKYLKGALVFYEKKFHKTHDLITLENLLAEKLAEVKNFHEEFAALNRYYIETRYPGDFPEFTEKEAKSALIATKKIKELILSKVA